MNRYVTALKRLNISIGLICQKYNCKPLGIWIDALWSFVVYGVTPAEYVGFGYYAMNHLAKRQFYTARHTAKTERALNDPLFSETFWRKEKFNAEFSNWVHRDWIYVPDATDEEIRFFLEKQEKVMVKPIDGSSGKGIYVYRGEPCSELRKNKCLLESFVVQHEKMASLNPTSVNTIRVYTIVDRKLQPHILSASIRVGGQGAEIDNYHAGGVGYPLDIDTGVVCAAGSNIFGGGTFLFHPGSGVQVIGFQVPNWEKLKEFVYSASLHLKSARFIAWDIAVTPDGFEMIEGNYEGDPGFMQTPSKIGKRYEIKRYT